MGKEERIMGERAVKEWRRKKAAGFPALVLLVLVWAALPVAATETAPRTAEEYLERGKVFAEQKDYEGAAADYSRAIALDPACLEAYIGRGDANMKLWNYGAAIADYSRAIEADAQNKDAYLKRGGAYQAENQTQAAWEDYVTAIRIDPEFTAAYSACGFLLSASGKHREAKLAEDDFARAREINTENRKIRESLALEFGFNF
jgi:tetratricopeptide (TPR) repeat protein